MQIKLRESISIYDVKYMGCDYEIHEKRGLGDEKMYEVAKKDGTKMNQTEVDTLIEQFKLEQ